MDGKGARLLLYGHMACPGTARARTYLATHRQRYVYRDIADSEAAGELRALGALATPAVVLDGRLIMVGFDERAFEEALSTSETRRLGGAFPGS